jgi:hypothetical protein
MGREEEEDAAQQRVRALSGSGSAATPGMVAFVHFCSGAPPLEFFRLVKHNNGGDLVIYVRKRGHDCNFSVGAPSVQPCIGPYGPCCGYLVFYVSTVTCVCRNRKIL